MQTVLFVIRGRQLGEGIRDETTEDASNRRPVGGDLRHLEIGIWGLASGRKAWKDLGITITWDRIILDHLSEIIWVHLGSSAMIWDDLRPSGSILDHLE